MGDVHGFNGASNAVTNREYAVPRWQAFAGSAGLSVLFIVVYGTTNWLASRRLDVPAFLFTWERSIPFVSFFILPYLSIDLFFVAAPFICRSALELRTFAWRIVAAICVAGLFFVFLPLRCAFPPPTAGGWLGNAFASFLNLDRPFNQLPSLHAALGLILFDLYFRRTRGLLRVLICAWFFLIALSPLLTHQHQVADIVTGLALAGYCCYAFRTEREPASAVTPNFKIASVYLAVAAPLFVVAVFDPRHWAILGWIAISLGLVSAAYFGVGPRIFRKRADGTIPWVSLFALGPCVVGQFCSLLYYRGKVAAYSPITSEVVMGCRPNKREAVELCQAGVTAVLDLSAELTEVAVFRPQPTRLPLPKGENLNPALRYLCVPVLDLTAPTSEQLDLVVHFIEAEARIGRVYVHCKIGYSRSATAVAAYLLFCKRAQTVAEAIEIIQGVRPRIVISAAALKTLEDFRLRLVPPPKQEAFLLASPVACGS